MQLGKRWTFGQDAPASLPSVVTEAVRSVEAEVTAGGSDAAEWRWTLTWLEGKPVVELDDGTTVTYQPASALGPESATIRSADDEDDDGAF
jgi:hypothetical protein